MRPLGARTRGAIALSAFLLLAASCTSGERNAAAPSSPPTETATSTPTPAPSPSPSPSRDRTVTPTPAKSASGPAPRPTTPFEIGVTASPDDLSGWLPQTKLPWDYAYQYLAGGTNTSDSWQNWNVNATFPLNYAKTARSHGYTAVFPYYELLQTKGPCNCASTESKQDLTNLNTPSVMATYFADFRMLMRRLGTGTWDGIKGFGHRAIVHVEPDLSGYAQQAVLDNGNCSGFCTGRGNNPSLLRASVASSGVSDVSTYPNTYRGFNLALLHLRDRYAPNVQLAFHVSTWSAIQDIGSTDDTSVDPATFGKQVARFAAQSGVVVSTQGTSTFEYVFNDVADRDAGYYRYVRHQENFWDRRNVRAPNFHRWEAFIASIASATRKPIVVWQIPLGNQYFRTENNTDGHYQDNKIEYFFAHIDELRRAGIVALLFGAGNPGSTNQTDLKRDGVTNPAPVCTTDGTSGARICPTHASTVADDDGGYLRMAATNFYRRN